MKRVCFVVATPISAISFLKDHIENLSKNFEITLVGDFNQHPDFQMKGLSETHHIKIERGINIKNDLAAVIKLSKFLRKENFDIVHSLTPKAGLVTSLAANFAGIKHRIHIFTGQVWATRKGFMRTLLKSMDKVIAACDNHILVDGESQRQFLIKEGVLSETNSQVLGAGSICGADTKKFTPNIEARKQERENRKIGQDKVVFAFLGRLNKDKGIFELLSAFNRLVESSPSAVLILWGRDEEECLARLNEYKNIKEGENFYYPGYTNAPELSLQVADVFCLPSYREGFGMSIVEASCLGLPVICSDAYGMADTIADNETGIRCKVADVQSLYEAMKYLYDNPQERERMGKNGRKRVLELFPAEKIVKAWEEFYLSLA